MCHVNMNTLCFMLLYEQDDKNKPGCYNLRCDGFVPVNYAPITPGDILEPNNGRLKVTIKIFKVSCRKY